MSDQRERKDRAALLAAYDEQLRTAAEVAGSERHDRVGPLWRAVFSDGGFVSYRDLGGIEGAELDALIADTVHYFSEETEVDDFEWKTRGHDLPTDLGQRLIAAGLEPDELETVMVGDATNLVQEVDVPDGIEILRVDDRPDRLEWLEQTARLNGAVFGRSGDLDALLDRLAARPDLIEVWVAHHDGQVVASGRLEEVAGSEFAGIWGGATDPAWRGRGIYRALTAARARSALDRGLRYLHSDSSPMSRPILERSGLVAITTTTPYLWRRAAVHS